MTIVDCCDNNSNALIELAEQNSHALIECCKNNSNTILAWCVNVLDGCLTDSIELKRDHFYTFFDVTTVCSNICIDGRGQTIHFPDSDIAKLRILEDRILTLKNITLSCIRGNTFDMRAGSRIHIDEDVTFEFSENMTFSQGLIRVVDTFSGFNIFNMCGKCGRKKFILDPVAGAGVLLDLGTNTLQLTQMDFTGLGFLGFQTGILTGAIAMSGESAVNVDVDTAITFVVENYENYLYMLFDNLTLAGSILFGDCPSNILNVRALITSPIEDKVGVKDGNYVINLTGDPGVFLTSNEGVAGLIFDDLTLSLNNAGINSFVIDFSSFLTSKRIELLGNPIKQNSTEFRLDAEELTGGQIDTSFVRSPVIPPVTALHLERQREKEAFAQEAAQYEGSKPHHHVGPRPDNSDHSHKPAVRPRPGTSNEREVTRQDEELDDIIVDADGRARLSANGRATSTLNLPAAFDIRYFNTNVEPKNNLSGNILFDNAKYRNFTINPATDLNLTLSNGSLLEIRPKTESIALEDNHFINVIGKGNEIVVRGTLKLNNNIRLHPDAELKITFAQSANKPKVIIPEKASLQVARRATVLFDGQGLGSRDTACGENVQSRGRVCMENGSSILLCGTRLKCSTRGVSSLANVQFRSTVAFSNKVLLDLAEDAVASIDGIGEVDIANGSSIFLSKPSELVFGSQTADDILLDIGNSEIKLVPVAPSASLSAILAALPADEAERRSKAKISFQKASADLFFNDAGRLFIGNNGLLELNARGRELRRGCIRNIDFGNNGSMTITEGGKLAFGPNAVDPHFSIPVSFPIAKGVPLNWEGNGSLFFVNGLVEFVGRPAADTGGVYKGFVAQAGTLIESLFDTIVFEAAEDIIKRFAQLNSSLIDGLLYVNADGVTLLRTPNGITVPLLPGDVITGETATGSITGSNGGVAFTISPAGVRT